jgi:putative ABC transport system permease protein
VQFNTKLLAPRVLANLYIAIDAVIANRVRSLLTALGIIFGVAAVIAMLAIGNGAQQEILWGTTGNPESNKIGWCK